ncbi:MAG: hypothetical protein IJS33_01295 [Firmicutes bacterium]|nr:hypothetical protein [Bacillota bacterium]
MKKTMIVVMLILLLMGSCFVYADDIEEPVQETDVADYVAVDSAEAQLVMSGNRARCTVIIEASNSSNANKVVLTVNYVKSNGVSVGTESVTVYRSDNLFTGITTKRLTSHGRYYAKVTVKVYYNSQLIESFYLRSRDVVY